MHPGPFTSAVGDKKIKMLRREGQKTKAVKLGYWLDSDAPVGTALRDRGCNRIVGFWLIGIAGGSHAIEQLVGKHARAGAGVAVDH